MVQMSKKRWNSLQQFWPRLWLVSVVSCAPIPRISDFMSYLYTRDIILVIAITKCQRANILPIRARCSVC